MQQPAQLLPSLCMKRDHLDGLPPVALPAGYSLRGSQDGDGRFWSLILNETFGGERTEESFITEMVQHYAYRPERIFFICAPDGTPCATASAYQQQEWSASTGYLHYVATRPCHAGRKLGYQVSLAVLHKFRAEGWTDAVLNTDDFRLPAIKTYLRLGFHPLLVHENQLPRWQTLLSVLDVAEDTVQMEWMHTGGVSC